MSTIEEVTSLFKDRAAKLPPIIGKLTNEYIKHLRELLSNLLQAVKLPGCTDSKCLITIGIYYKSAHSRSTFDRLDMPLEVYDLEIPSDVTTTIFIRDKREWMANLLRQRFLRAAECGARTLVIGAVEDTWWHFSNASPTCLQQPL